MKPLENVRRGELGTPKKKKNKKKTQKNCLQVK